MKFGQRKLEVSYIRPMDKWMDKMYKKFHFILALILQLNKLDSWCRLLHNLPFL